MEEGTNKNTCLWLGFIYVAICLLCCLFCTLMAIFGVWAGVTSANSCPVLINNIAHGKYNAVGKKYEADARYELVIYQVEGNTIANPRYPSILDNLKPLQQDTNTHNLIWNYFSQILPYEQRKNMYEFQIITDGTGGRIAGQAGINPVVSGNKMTEQWVLYVDPADFVNEKQFTWVLIHEFGHFITLSPTQYDFDNQSKKCSKYIWGLYGCSRPDSYIELYYQAFWKDIDSQWYRAAEHTGPDEATERLDAYFHTHRKDFVDRYAATSITEDIAESWTAFILYPKQKGVSVVEQKINFFYQFPELVELRSKIIEGICNYNHLQYQP